MQGINPAKQGPATGCPGERLLFLMPVLGPQLGLQMHPAILGLEAASPQAFPLPFT